MLQRTRTEILTEIQQVRANRAMNRAWAEVVAECNKRLAALQDELKALPGSGPWDDEETPEVAYRPPSCPPSAPRGRPRK